LKQVKRGVIQIITIRVFNRDAGNVVVSGTKVTVITGRGTLAGYTDSRGSADFDLPSGTYQVSVRGKIVHKGPCVGVTIVYI